MVSAQKSPMSLHGQRLVEELYRSDLDSAVEMYIRSGIKALRFPAF